LTPGSGIRDEYFGSYFREFKANFLVKILKFFGADADSGSENLFDPGSGMEKFGSGIREKHPGSATLGLMSFPVRFI
jgi:hypothetical protein